MKLNKTARTQPGRHRRITTAQTTKGRIAAVTVAVSAVSGAGVSGAAAATVTNSEDDTQNIALAADATTQGEIINEATEAIDAGVAAAEQPSPQILAIADYKPVNGLEEQLTKAVDASVERAEEEAALRGPSVVKPAEGAFTSGFGARWGSMHNGIDIANAVGTPILAVMDGTVIDSGPASGFGNWIRIKHDDGSISVYGHMETLAVGVGEHVTAGQNIAGMGNRGFSTGSHLHFEIHPAGGGPVDPQPWLAERGITL